MNRRELFASLAGIAATSVVGVGADPIIESVSGEKVTIYRNMTLILTESLHLKSETRVIIEGCRIVANHREPYMTIEGDCGPCVVTNCLFTRGKGFEDEQIGLPEDVLIAEGEALHFGEVDYS